MEAEQAREQSRTSAEKMREVSEAARANERAEAESSIEALKESIEAAARLERETIDKSIEEAANMGQNSVTHKYTVRVSASRNSREEVAFIETIADATSALVVESLQNDGFKVVTGAYEERDFRDGYDAQIEYYETYFSVKW